MEVADCFENSSGNPDVVTQKTKYSNYYRHENSNLTAQNSRSEK